MGWFSWFSRRSEVKPSPETSGLLHMDKTRPVHPDRSHKAWVDPPEAQHAANRKSERIERRELLYSVVRDTMVRVGVLSSSYKFKVLSLDQRGRQFLVMMDVSPEVGLDNVRLSEIEVVMAQTAKARHDILVTAVYWRLNEHVAVGLTSPRPVRPPVKAVAPKFEPIESDEVEAFRKAIATGGGSTAPVPPSTVVRSGPRHVSAPPRHEADAEESRPQALSNTQYGDLN